MILGIHHLGIAVKNIDEATKRYVNAFGIQAGKVHHVPERGMKAVLLDVGPSKLELIEYSGKEGTPAPVTEVQGERITHICFEVDDIKKDLASLSAKGIPLRDKVPRQGITGIVAFLLPEAMNGVSIEFVEKASAR